MPTNPFARAQKRLENSTHYYWQLLEQAPVVTLQKQPEAGKWSPLQVMVHLAGAEEVGFSYLQRKLYTPLQSRSLLPGAIRALLLSIALKSPLKFKAPPALNQSPSNTTDPKALLAHWKKVRKDLYQYLEAVPAAVRDKPLFRHPAAGALNLEQMLNFMADHLDHHRRQLNIPEQKKVKL